MTTSEAEGAQTGNLAASDAAEEAKKWGAVSGLARGAMEFWLKFLGAEMDGKKPLDAAAMDRLLRIVRAVSWVESRHGTGTGASAANDPMQCGQDAWWKELVGLSGDGSRWVRGDKLTNHWSRELPDLVAALATFPEAARVSKLKDRAKGNRDPGFTQTTSYYWGVPWLMHRINYTAGTPTYQFGDLSRARLVNGAVKYNVGNPKYRTEIEAALDLAGAFPLAEPLLSAAAEYDPGDHVERARGVLASLLGELRDAGTPRDGEARVLFPNGIDDVDLEVSVGPSAGVVVRVHVRGPRAAG